MTADMTLAEYTAEVNQRMTETAFQAQVIAAAHDLGWRVAHFRSVKVQRKDGSVHYTTPVQADGKGWPDLVLVRERDQRVIYAELKKVGEYPRPEQRAWLEMLKACEQDVYVWRPGDDYLEVLM